jgi:hypothetical protein
MLTREFQYADGACDVGKVLQARVTRFVAIPNTRIMTCLYRRP